MGILDEDVARVREATDFVAVAGEHIALKRRGQRWVGLCPFHAEKTPSFSVNAELGFYYCFGCGAKGDVITFVRELDHLDFVEAVERLAAKAGVGLRYDDASTGRDRQRRDRLVEATAGAVTWYHERLLAAPDAGAARNYLRSRGYDGDVVQRFRLGWAPDDWDALAQSLSLTDDLLRATGLGFVNRRGRQQDTFRGRIMFPIFDVSGRPVAFGGRILPAGPGTDRSAEAPKYVNSPETAIYSKSRTLYGLNWAKSGVVEAGEVIVCEGYTDVIGFSLAGLPRAVATCGTALADEHFRILKNFARRVVLAYDADAAGQAAAERFYEWERRYEVDIVVASLPSGEDPADLAQQDPDRLRSAVGQARPFLAFRIDRALDAADLRTPEGRAHAAENALAAIAEHPNELVRDQYLMQVADRCRIDAARLRSSLPRIARDRRISRREPRGGGPRPPGPGEPAAADAGPQPAGAQPAAADAAQPAAGAQPAAADAAAPGTATELEALRLAIHRPDEVIDRLDEALFTIEVNLTAYRALAASATIHEAIESAGAIAGGLIQRLAVEEADTDPDDVITRLLSRAGARALADLEAEARAANDPERLTELARITGWLKLTLVQLDEPESGIDAAGRLVAWLLQRGEEDA